MIFNKFITSSSSEFLGIGKRMPSRVSSLGLSNIGLKTKLNRNNPSQTSLNTGTGTGTATSASVVAFTGGLGNQDNSANVANLGSNGGFGLVNNSAVKLNKREYGNYDYEYGAHVNAYYEGYDDFDIESTDADSDYETQQQQQQQSYHKQQASISEEPSSHYSLNSLHNIG